jgi:hypothetical protein
MTRGQLLDNGGFEVIGSWAIELDGVTYWPKESENGNGWYAGDCDDNDNLIYEQAQ